MSREQISRLKQIEGSESHGAYSYSKSLFIVEISPNVRENAMGCYLFVFLERKLETGVVALVVV